MANRVVIDVEARFIDKVTAGMSKAAKSTEKLNKELDKIDKKNVKPKLGADDNAFTKKIRAAEQRAAKFGKTKTAAVLGAVDKATTVIGKATGAARAFASKSFRASVSVADKASTILGGITGAARSFAGKTFNATVGIIDKATTPLRKIRDSLFNIKTLIGTIVAGAAVNKAIEVGVKQPVGLSDSIESARIAFENKLGSTDAANQFLEEIYKFDEKSPFDTVKIVGITQQMMNMGWDTNNVLADLEKMGDWAASMGKGEEGISAVTRALGQMRQKGKLSSEEMLQLTEAGVSAWDYLAKHLGVSVPKVREMAEDGAIDVNDAITGILAGMEEFSGSAAANADRTVSGIIGQLQSLVQTKLLLPWGDGLSVGLKEGLGKVKHILDDNKDTFEGWGEDLKDVGEKVSMFLADKLEDTIDRAKKIMASDEFKNASLFGKAKLLFEGTVLDPLKEWWNSDSVQSWIEEKKQWLTEKAAGWGESLGRGLTNGIKTLLGIEVTDTAKEGIEIGSSFAEGFAKGFDGSAVTDAIVTAIKNVWSALPTWAQVLIGGYVGGKAISGLASGYLNVVGAVSSIAGGTKKAIGGFDIASSVLPHLTSSGTGILGTMGKAGVALGASTTKGAILAGGAGIAGGIAAGASTIKGGYDLYKAYKAYKAGDETEAKARSASGGTTLAGVATGAAIGSIFGPVGTLVGAGIGGVAGWIGGNKWADSIREANIESEELKETLENSEASAEEIAIAMEKAAKTKLAERFGDIELSMEEIETLAKNITFGAEAKNMEKFATATQTAEQSLQTFKTAASDMERLEFDMSERTWKVKMGLEEKLSEEEIEEVKARVQNYIDSAEKVLSDQHYQFNAAVEVLLQPSEREGDLDSYGSLIGDGNTMYAKLQEELDGLTKDLTAKYNLYLEDGVITADEQGTLSRIQGKIAEIMEKVSKAETEATFEVSKLKFTTGDLSAESFEQFQASLQTQLANYQTEQEEALTVAISEIQLELAEGTITQDQYDEKLKTLVDNYNTNIENMTARVSNVQLEGISEAFDGAATVEQLQGAIDEIVASGEDPLELTFDDINAHIGLKDDALSEDDKLAFAEVMQSAIESAASGDNALTTTAEVDPTIKVSEEANINEELKTHLESQLEEEETPSITPSLNVNPELAFQLEEGAGEGIKSECETQVSSYLTGENSINTTANVYAAAKMYGTEGIPLSEEASNGRTNVSSAIDTAFTDPFSASADANITLNWKITNPTTTLSFSGGGASGSTVSATVGGNAAGGFISGGPQLSWLDEEGTGEVVIPFNPSRRARALELYAETGRRLGITNHANGGFVGGDDSPMPSYEGEIPAGSGEQKIEVNMGGVTIEIKTDGSKPIAQSIEDQEQEIAERVAKIFKNVFSAQFANRPLKGGA